MAIKRENFSPELPMELITEVLARLPVKSLMRFRCVCKAWHSLISSSDFAVLHLSCFHNNDDTTHFLGKILRHPRRTPAWPEPYRLVLASSKTYERITQDEYSIWKDRVIVDRSEYDYFPFGSSVNGILFLTTPVLNLVEKRIDREIMLWNPIIRKTRKIPPFSGGGCPFMGLGYSHPTNDYKLVAITRDENPSARVYSLRTDTWRNIEYRGSVHYRLMADGSSLFQGTICFITLNHLEQRSRLILFNVDDEVFKYVEVPSELGVEEHWKYPVAYHGKIGLLDIAPRQCTLWMTGNDQNLGSWTKLYTVHFQEMILASSMLFFKNNGEFMLFNYKGQMGIYNVESGEVKHLTGDFTHFEAYCTPYKESLVLL